MSITRISPERESYPGSTMRRTAVRPDFRHVFRRAVAELGSALVRDDLCAGPNRISASPGGTTMRPSPEHTGSPRQFTADVPQNLLRHIAINNADNGRAGAGVLRVAGCAYVDRRSDDVPRVPGTAVRNHLGLVRDTREGIATRAVNCCPSVKFNLVSADPPRFARLRLTLHLSGLEPHHPCSRTLNR